MSRRAFTLIELLVIVAIMATMVTVSVVSIRAGQGSARIKGATRNVMASIRHARSIALVTMQPAVITYSTETIDDEACAQIRVDGAKISDSSKAKDVVETLSGEKVRRDGTQVERDTKGKPDDGEQLLAEDGGQTVEDVLFAPVSVDVVRGVRIKVTMGDEGLAADDSRENRADKISVFSNVDYLLGRYKEQKKAEEKAKSEDADPAGAPPSAKDEGQEPVSVIWEANGRCDPHSVWVYLDGTAPDRGLCIKVDRFGAAKVVSDDDED